MVANHRLTSQAVTDAVNSTEDTPLGPSIDDPKSTAATGKRKKKKKKQTLDSYTASSASSNNCNCATSSSQNGIKISRNPKRIRVGSFSTTTARRIVGPSDVDALGLPLGMSIAAVVAQVLERKNGAVESISVNDLSEICILAVQESLGNIFGDKFDNFVTNFEKSFRSTLMTLRLISGSSQNVDQQHAQRPEFLRRCSCSVPNIISSSTDKLRNLTHLSGPTEDDSNLIPSGIAAGPHPSPGRIQEFTLPSSQSQTCPQMEEIKRSNHPMNQELLLHDQRDEHQLACLSNSTGDQLSLIERSVNEQTRSNNLKEIEIGLTMRRLQVEEAKLELNTIANLLKRFKLSIGIAEASFKADKFKTKLQESREVELLTKCMDFLVAGLVVMLFSLGYGMYVYSHRRIIETTEACSPYTESKSWWMPKSMATFNTGLQLLKCQSQALIRMLSGIIMIGAITAILIQRSSASQQTMPVTFIVLLLGFVCGGMGKFCVDTLGGSGIHWLVYWEVLCVLHFLSNMCRSSLYIILNGPITVAERVESKPVFPYWIRRLIFFVTLLFIPLLCGFMPFAGPWEWLAHFQSRASDFLTLVDED